VVAADVRGSRGGEHAVGRGGPVDFGRETGRSPDDSHRFTVDLPGERVGVVTRPSVDQRPEAVPRPFVAVAVEPERREDPLVHRLPLVEVHRGSPYTPVPVFRVPTRRRGRSGR
jgi:hypothetical protein